MSRKLAYSGTKKERQQQAVEKYQKTEKGKVTIKRHQKSEIAKNYQKTKKGKITSRKAHLKITYGLTLAEYDKMFEEQNGTCAICNGINIDGRRLFIEHNHKTGKIRGLLCYRCNTTLGILENIEFCKKANKYLKEH